MLSAVEYVTKIIVNDPTRMLKLIGNDFGRGDGASVVRLTRIVTLAKKFLKNQYDKHDIEQMMLCALMA